MVGLVSLGPPYGYLPKNSEATSMRIAGIAASVLGGCWLLLLAAVSPAADQSEPLAPKDAKGFYERGNAEIGQGDLDKAVTDHARYALPR